MQEVSHVGGTAHSWTVCVNECDFSATDDATVAHMAQAVRDAYGESEIVEMLIPDSDVADAFDVKLVLAGFRKGLPDPEDEKTKPINLRNYRSETCEFFARETLKIIHKIETPGALHAGKGNAMQPLLGFDGWGLKLTDTGDAALVLIQVKGSDDGASPPQVAAELANECLRIAPQTDKLARAISAALMRVKGTAFVEPLLRMLEQLGAEKSINLVVAPVVVRGQVEAKMTDLKPVRDAHPHFGPVVTMGMSVAIGAPLEPFGKTVMSKARNG